MLERLSALLAPVVAQAGLELWDLELAREHGRRVLRVLVDRPEGVSDEDCRLAATAISAALDEADPIPDAYTLEVASPGVDRRLRHAGDYARFAGSAARLHLAAPLAGREVLEGVIEGVADGQVSLRVGRGSVTVPLEQVREGRLTFAGFGPARKERGRDGQPITASH